MKSNVTESKIKMNFISWLTAIFFVFYISGFESTYVNYIVSAGAMGLSMAYIIMFNDNFSKSVWRSGAFKLMLAFLMLFFYYMFIYGNGTVKHTMANYIMFIPMVIYLFYETQPKILYGVFICLIVAWIVFAIRAYYMYSNELVSARQIASSLVNENVLTGGGYGFAVGSAMLSVFLFEMLIWDNIKKYKFWVLAFIVLLMLVIKETYSTITILATGCGILTAIIFKTFGINTLKSISVKHFLLVIFVVISVTLFLLYKEELGRYIVRINSAGENITQRRMMEIGHFLMASGDRMKNSADMSARMNMVKSSWELFLENPIFGVTYKYGAEELSRFGVGSHGEFADLLAKFGLVGGVPFIMVFLSILLKERKMQKSKIGFGYIITFAILIYFNPFRYFQSMVVFFFMIPAITFLFNSNINETNDLNEPLKR